MPGCRLGYFVMTDRHCSAGPLETQPFVMSTMPSIVPAVEGSNLCAMIRVRAQQKTYGIC